VQEISADLKKCESLFDGAVSSSHKLLLDDIKPDDRQLIELQVHNLRQDFESMTERVSVVTDSLEVRLANWTKYVQLSGRLFHWIDENDSSQCDFVDMSTTISGSAAAPDNRDLTEQLAKRERLKIQIDEIERRQDQARQLESLVDKLMSDGSEESRGLKKRLAEIDTALAQRKAIVQVSVGRDTCLRGIVSFAG
jgi:hypothetical protein